MSDDQEPKASAAAASAVHPLQWVTDPLPLYASNVMVAGDGRVFALTFLETPPGRTVVDTPQGPIAPARVVASIRMDVQGYFNAIALLTVKWNEFAAALEQAGAKAPVPRFKVVPDPTEVEVSRG